MNKLRTALGFSRILQLFSIMLLLCSSLVAEGATLHVLNLNDIGPGSLRDRIAIAAPGDTIVFDVIGTIFLNGSIAINKALTLQGPGASLLAISGSNKDRIFTTSGGPILIMKLTLRDGLAIGTVGSDGGVGEDGGLGGFAAGGAINNSGDLTLLKCWFTANRVVGGNGGRGGDNVLGTAYTPGTGGAGGLAYGGGIYSSVNMLHVGNCTFSDNRAEGGKGGRGGDNLNFAVPKSGGTGGTGGKGQAGGLGDSAGPALTNCTFSANVAIGGAGGRGGDTSANMAGGKGGDGGEGYSGGFFGFSSQGFLLKSSTVVLNEAHGGTPGPGGNGSPIGSTGSPGIGHAGGVGGSTMLGCLNALANTILAMNSADMHPNQETMFQDFGYNFLGDDDTTGPCINLALTKMGTLGVPLDPMLGPLAQNGGGIPTHAPLNGSPVIDQGSSFFLPADQRGAPRTYDFGNIANFDDGTDIGAVELGSTPMGLSIGGGGSGNGGNVVVSWPDYYGDLKLQSISSLQGHDEWTDVRDAPVLIEDRFYFTNRMTDPSKFFRLINR